MMRSSLLTLEPLRNFWRRSIVASVRVRQRWFGASQRLTSLSLSVLAETVAVRRWRYPFVDFGEPAFPDGSAIRRPVVPLVLGSFADEFAAVVDSGSPMSLASPGVLARLGVDVDRDEPLYSVPLGMGSAFGSVPVFAVELLLQAPPGVDAEPVRWHLHLGSRPSWRFPFSVLFGQRGWFDTFTTTISGFETTVEVPDFQG
jgi:hypothetical protein